MTESSVPLPSSIESAELKRLRYSEFTAFEVSSPINRAKRSQSLTTARPEGWNPPTFTPNKNSALHRLTVDLAKTYGIERAPTLNPRRVLTKVSEPVSNDNCDNINADYILYVNDIIGSYSGHQYRVLDLLGQGTFGQVVKAVNSTTKEQVAIKIVKNKHAYFNQGLVEIQILEMLNHQFDQENKHHIVRLMDYFVFRNHLCLVFELLSINLYELLKQNNFKGLSMTLLRCFLTQILDALATIGQSEVLHCDLKPENILLCNLTSPTIKIIDFGSACFENRTVYSYIQSRFYRSPEVLLGSKYSWGIDMWSLGCISAELFLGLPLLPGSSEYNQIYRIVDMFGDLPENLLVNGEKAHKYFDPPGNGRKKYSLKSEEQFAKENNIPIQTSKKYFKFKSLKDIVSNYMFKEGLSDEDVAKEKQNRVAFVDFLEGLLQLDPEKRWTADQAAQHPFMTGAPFTGPFVPPPRIPAHIKPRVIPWGIQPAALAQRHVSMSFPENYMALQNFPQFNGQQPLGNSYNQGGMLHGMNMGSSPVNNGGNHLGMAHSMPRLGNMLHNANSFDSSFNNFKDQQLQHNSPQRNGLSHGVPMNYSSPHGNMNNSRMNQMGNQMGRPHSNSYSSGGVVGPIPNFGSLQNQSNSPRNNNTRNSPRAGHQSSPRLANSKSSGYVGSSLNEGRNSQGGSRNNQGRNRTNSIINTNNNNNNPTNNNNMNNNQGGRQRSKSELPTPGPLDGKQNWKDQRGNNRGSLNTSNQNNPRGNERNEGSHKNKEKENSRRRARSSSGSQGLPKPIFDSENTQGNLSAVSEVTGDRDRDSSSESPPPAAERWDEDIFYLETDNQSPKMPPPKSSGMFGNQQQMQMQQQMFNNFSGMRIGNNGIPTNSPSKGNLNANGTGYSTNMPIHQSQSLPTQFYDQSLSMSPHHMQNWNMNYPSGSPYGHYLIPPPTNFGHLSGIPPSMLQQPQSSSNTQHSQPRK